MNILITGGAGFIGSHLSERLLENSKNKITVIDNFDDYYPRKLKEANIKDFIGNENYVFYEADINNPDKLKQIFADNSFDIVIHIAAKAGVRNSIKNPIDYAKTNIIGTLNILECMKEYNVKKLIFASSSSVYGNSESDTFSEDLDISKPISPYAATKASCEQFLYTYSHLYGINVVALRFFTVYGPKQRPDLAINKFVRCIKEDKPVTIYGNGDNVRSYTYISDIIDGILAAIKYNKSAFEIINLGGIKTVSVNEMVETIEKVLGKKAMKEYLPMQAGDVNKTVCDITKARKLLGYYPKISFEEGVDKFCKWYESVYGD